MTGDPYFPGGLGIFDAPKDKFLVFEKGPSVDVQLQWATYSDAADECSLSRIYGGIHPSFDDIPGRFLGAKVAKLAFEKAASLWEEQPWYKDPVKLGVFGAIVSAGTVAGIAGLIIGIMRWRDKQRKLQQGWNLHNDEVQMEAMESEAGNEEVEEGDEEDSDLS